LFDVPGLFVHTETSFEPVKDLWIKINNEWAPVETAYIKNNGIWEPLLGSFAPEFSLITDGFGQAPRPATATASEPDYEPPVFVNLPVSEGGGWRDGPDPAPTAEMCGPNDGPGGGKIICTAMNQTYGFGSFRQAIWLRYSADHMTKAHEAGYHAIFMPLVDAAYKQQSWYSKPLRKTLENIARHRTADLRAEMRGTKRDRLGRAYRWILEPLCYAVGKLKGY
jgi:hypothetical protein